MPAPRRGRACDACHGVKIKCELGSVAGGEPPCQRCVRLGKECSISAQVRQKDRIAELEAKIEEMTRLMRLQEIRIPSQAASDHGELPLSPASIESQPTESAKRKTTSKKRRLGSGLEDGIYMESSRTTSRCLPLEIGRLVPQDLQIQLLQRYRNEIEPFFPFPITKSYEVLRDEHPLLLHAVMFAAGPGVLSNKVRDEVSAIILKSLSPSETIKVKGSVELIQAIVLAAFWYRPTKNHTHVAIERLVDSVLAIAADIGISNPDHALSVGSSKSSSEIVSSDAWRTWILCYLLTATMGSCLRTLPKITWDADFEMRIASLEYGIDTLGTDPLLCQYARAERLCQQIMEEAGYNTSEPTIEVTDRTKFQRLQNLITERKVQNFSAPSNANLKLYENFAIMFLHECVLHTSTNKRSFAAPYLSERLSSTDFPAPVVTADHITSLYKLRDACHGVLNITMNLDNMAMASSPLLIFNTRVFLALWLLIKFYVAVTASGNTYGAYIDPQSLELETYLGKFAEIGDALIAIDETSLAGLGLQSARRLREWVWNYDAVRVEESLDNFIPLQPGLERMIRNQNNIDWTLDPNTHVAGYGLENLFDPFPR